MDVGWNEEPCQCPRLQRATMVTVSPVSPTRGFVRLSLIAGVSATVTAACPTGCRQMLTRPAKGSIGAVRDGITRHQDPRRHHGPIIRAKFAGRVWHMTELLADAPVTADWRILILGPLEPQRGVASSVSAKVFVKRLQVGHLDCRTDRSGGWWRLA